MRLRVGARVVLVNEGRTVEFTDLQQATLLMLADAGRSGLHRRRVAEVLWEGDDGSTSPRRRLRQIVYAVNKRARHSVLTGDQSTLALDSSVEVIWTGEEAGRAVEPPTTAWSRLREDLHDRARARSRSHVASAVDSARLRDDPETILELVATDADPASMWRDAVWALLRAGRVREAEASFGELGITDPDTVRRCRGVLSRLASGDAPGPLPHAAEGPIVGREEVLGATISALERGDRRVILRGQSGVGLSRVLGAASAWVLTEVDDVVVASTRCTYSGRSVAYDTLNRLFDSDLFRAAHLEVEEPWRSILARVLRVYGRKPEREIEPLEGTSATLRVLHAISALIQRAIGNATLLAVVDDLHLADPGSLTVLVHLGVDGEGAVIRLLGSCRSDVRPEGPVAGLLDRDATTFVEVPPLDEQASELLLQRLRPDLSPDNRRALANLCSGFPRRLEDLANSLEGDGGEVRGATLDDLLEARLRDLGPAEQDVAALLSVRPDGLDADTLMAACELGTLDLARATRRLIELGIAEDGGRVRIWSSFLRRGIRSTIPEALRRVLHRRIAQALQRREPAPSGDIGRHLKEAGEGEDAQIWLVRGAREAAAAESFPVAIDLALIAVDLTPEDIDLLDMLGELLSSEGRFEEASEYLGRVCELDDAPTTSAGMLVRRLSWVRALCEHVFESDRVGGLARGIMEDARETGELDVEAQAIDLLFRIGDYCLDFDLVHEALGHLLSAREREGQSPYLDWVEVRRCYIDDPDRARSAARSFFEWSRPGTTDRLLALARLLTVGAVHGPAGDSDVLEALCALNAEGGSGDAHLRAIAISNFGNWHLERGDLPEAQREFKRSLGIARHLGGAVLGVIRSNTAEIHLRSGELDEADALLCEADEIRMQLPPRDRMVLDHARAWLEMERGRLRSAMSLIAGWSHIRPDLPAAFLLVLPISVAARVHVRMGRKEHALELVQAGLSRARALNMVRSEDAILKLCGELGVGAKDVVHTRATSLA